MKKFTSFIILAGLFLVVINCKKTGPTDADTNAEDNDPSASFASAFQAEGTVSFTNASKNASSYLWNFGDSTTSTSNAVTVVHQYNRNGTYRTTLTAYGNGKSASASSDLNITTVTNFFIGESYGGGIIFYINETGHHGFIAAAGDQSAVAQWGCYGTSFSTSPGLGSGQGNTEIIVAGCTTAGIAAQLCDALELGGYSDWFLPSKDELNRMYVQQSVIGGFAAGYYWSSSEINGTNAWRQNFANGDQGNFTKFSAGCVRAIRAF
jgi:PKD repeat protein